MITEEIPRNATQSAGERSRAKKRVLFLCTGNSARSQMAEGLLRSIAGKEWEAYSAGTHPKEVHPLAVSVMQEVDINLDGHTSKDLTGFIGQEFDYVITVCSRAEKHCPVFPGAEPIHWGFDDPAEAPSERKAESFRKVRDQIRQRLNLFLLVNSR